MDWPQDPVPNDSDFKIASPNFSVESVTDIHNLKDFSKNSAPDFILIFEDIHLIFCILTHPIDLIRWYDLYVDQKILSRVCGT